MLGARIKSMFGPSELPVVASQAALPVPDAYDAFVVSGTTGVTSIVPTVALLNRTIRIIGENAAATSVAFTATPAATATTGQMVLINNGCTLARGESLTLRMHSTGVWQEVSRSVPVGS